MSILTKEQLLAAPKSRAIREVELPQLGVVKVRNLTRSEVHSMRDTSMSEADLEAKTISLILVEPSLTFDEVKTLLDTLDSALTKPLIDQVLISAGTSPEETFNEAARRFQG